LTYPDPIYAGQAVTAGELSQMSGLVSAPVCSGVYDTTVEGLLASFAIPANDPGLGAGGVYELTLTGNAYCTGTPPNLEINVRLGTVTGTLLGSTGTLACRSGMTGACLFVRQSLAITTAGADGTCDGLTEIIANFVATTSARYLYQVQDVTIDTSAAVFLVVTAQFTNPGTTYGVEADAGVLRRV
jgi:hypothetical protein